MPADQFMLATADEIRAIYARAKARMRALREGGGADEEDEEEDVDVALDKLQNVTELFRATMDAIRFCCVAAGQLGDPSLVPLVREAYTIARRYNDFIFNHTGAMAGAIEMILRSGARVDEHIKGFAAHKDPDVREAVAKGLRPIDAREIDLLEKLAQDPSTEVRTAAKRSLGPAREVAWWRGKFSRDPALQLSEEEAARHKPALAALSSMLDKPSYQWREQKDELCEAVRTLPDGLAIDFVETFFSKDDILRRAFPAMFTVLLERAGGASALFRIIKRSGDSERVFLDSELVTAISALPRDRRAVVCKELAAYAADAPENERGNGFGSAAYVAAAVVGKAWPTDEDLSPLLDLVLSFPPSPGRDIDWIVSGFAKAFWASSGASGALLERLLEGRLAGYPGIWANIGASVDALLERVHGPRVREAVEKAILSEARTTVQWGLRRLLSSEVDPLRGESREELLQRLLAEPKYRALLFQEASLTELAVPVLRGLLREGQLNFQEASAIMRAIGALYGGVAEPTVSRSRHRDTKAVEERRTKRVAELDRVLGPPELRGPPTEEEWRLFSEARARWIESGLMPRSPGFAIIGAFRDGPWSPDDKAAMQAMLRAVDEGSPDSDAFCAPLATLFAEKPDSELVDAFDILLKRSRRGARRIIKMSRKDMLNELGMPDPRARREAASGAQDRPGPVEWMDEDDDDAEG